MTNEDKAFWLRVISALEGGGYRHGKHGLFDRASGTHCCLGVACDLDPEVRWKELGEADDEFYMAVSGSWSRFDMPPVDGPYHGMTEGQLTSIVDANDRDSTTDYAPSIALIMEYIE